MYSRMCGNVSPGLEAGIRLHQVKEQHLYPRLPQAGPHLPGGWNPVWEPKTREL